MMPKASQLHSGSGAPKPPTTKPRTKRAFHNKVKTGCKTCKIRRVRCDEQKPSCNRCTSTGRKCDGYPTDSLFYASCSRDQKNVGLIGELARRAKSPLSPTALLNASSDVRLQFLHRDPEQVRSFRYFLQVAAPAIAGTFSSQFWTSELPQACHDDPAVWHAVVSLGAVYEDHVALGMAAKSGQPYKNLFALDQFNQSVRHLVKGLSASKDRWRAVITSTIFTSVCMIEGLYEQARIHMTAGRKLLQEIEAEAGTMASEIHPEPRFGHTSKKAAGTKPTDLPTPISITAIRGVQIGLDLWLQGMGNGGMISIPPTLLPDDGDSQWYIWSKYSAPMRSYKSDILLTKENLLSASQAAESLLIGMVIFSRKYSTEMERLYIERSLELVILLSSLQEPLVESFKELHEALMAFQSDYDNISKTTKARNLELEQMRLSLLFLTMYIATIRIFIVPMMQDFPFREDMADFTVSFPTAIRLAEEIIELETQLKHRLGRQVLAGLTPPLSTPMSIVTVAAPLSDTRRRAAKILQRPRIEGLLDGSPMASLSQAILAAEAAADKEHRKQVALSGADPDPFLKGYTPGQDEEVHPLSRSYVSGFAESSRGEGTVYIRTWRDHITGSKGKKVRVTW